MPMRLPAPGDVPSSFAPSVSESDMPVTPANSPWVSPMRNAAPGQLAQASAAVGEVGATEAKMGNTIGDAVQNTMDEATTKAAENQFLQAALPAIGQYKTTEGMNAVQQYQPTAQAIVQARQDARQTLTNPIQQRMFDQVTNDHLITLGSQMADHESTQRMQYAKQQGNARADNMNAQALMAYLNGDNAGYTKYTQIADGETLGVAQLSGAAPGSDVAASMLRAKRSDLADGIVVGLLSRHAVSEADQYFQGVQPNLDSRTSERLDNALKSAHMQEDPKIFGQQAIASALGVKGPGVLQPPIPGTPPEAITTEDGVDGINIHAAAGAKVLAPASGTVTKVWIDQQMGRSAQIALPNGYTATFNGLNAVNYTEGQKITVGQTLGLSGQNDAGQGVLHYEMTGPDGKAIDPRTASSSPIDPKNFNTPDQEEKAINWVNQNVADPDTQKLTEGYIRGIANTNRQITNQEHAAVLKQVTDFWFDNGQSLHNLPANLSSQLTPEDRLSFVERAEQMHNLSQQLAERRSVPLLANWIDHPEGLPTDTSPGKQATAFTVDNVRKAYAQGMLSDDGFKSALRGAVALAQDNANLDPQKVIAATVDNEQIENTLLQNGHADIANPKENTPQQAQKVALRSEIQDQIDAAQQGLKAPLSRDQKQSIIDSTILNSRYLNLPGGWFSSDQPKAPWELTPDTASRATYTSSTGKTVPYVPIPPAAHAAAIQSLLRRNQPISERNIYDTWVNSGMVGAKPQGK